jgi:hypothetical protein
MKLCYKNDLSSLQECRCLARQADITTFSGRPVLRLDGLILFPEIELISGLVEVEIAAEKSCYPGVAFRIQDEHNYELTYVQPHTSEQWDALQYDPVFHANNTWQLYQGPAYQKSARIPAGEWIRLRVGFDGPRLAVQVGEQPPLVVEQLAHPSRPGWAGLWTYLPAYFRNLKIWDQPLLPAHPGDPPSRPAGVVTEWLAEGFGVLPCEPNGALNVNRFLPVSARQVRLKRSFDINLGEHSINGSVQFQFGFSDALSLALDGQEIYQGEHKFAGFDNRSSRGYVDYRNQTLILDMAPGRHTLTATLDVSESFGWGLVLACANPAVHWLPAGLG